MKRTIFSILLYTLIIFSVVVHLISIPATTWKENLPGILAFVSDVILVIVLYKTRKENEELYESEKKLKGNEQLYDALTEKNEKIIEQLSNQISTEQRHHSLTKKKLELRDRKLAALRNLYPDIDDKLNFHLRQEKKKADKKIAADFDKSVSSCINLPSCSGYYYKFKKLLENYNALTSTQKKFVCSNIERLKNKCSECGNMYNQEKYKKEEATRLRHMRYSREEEARRLARSHEKARISTYHLLY